MKILISGAGIAGPTLAYWLAHYGMEPTIIEESSRLRTGGYIIDFFGAGFDIAERMGMLPDILSKGYRVQEVEVVDREGKRVAGFSAETFARVAQGRYTSLLRGTLAASIFEKIDGKVESIFGDSITRIEQSSDCVRVEFQHSSPRKFDRRAGHVSRRRGVLRIAARRAGISAGDGGSVYSRGRDLPSQGRLGASVSKIPGVVRSVCFQEAAGGIAVCRIFRAKLETGIVCTQSDDESDANWVDRGSCRRRRYRRRDRAPHLLSIECYELLLMMNTVLSSITSCSPLWRRSSSFLSA